MRISVNDVELLTLSEIQKKVIKNDIDSAIFESDMARRLHYINDHPCRQCVRQHGQKMRDVIKAKGITHIASDGIKFAEEYFKHEDLPLGNEQSELIVKIDGKESHRITATHKKLIKKLKKCASVDQHCKDQMKWILTHKYERCMERLRVEWEPKLKEKGIQQLPLDDDAFANLVFSQADYKDKKSRES